MQAIGHVDFYPNHGPNVQTGCEVFDIQQLGVDYLWQNEQCKIIIDLKNS